MTTTHPLLRQITESLKRTNELRGELARVCRPLGVSRHYSRGFVGVQQSSVLAVGSRAWSTTRR